MSRFLLITLFCLVVSPTFSHALTGKVISIADGDTLTIVDSSKKQHKIRLYGIDTPEKGQPFGKAAKKYTAKLTARKTATVTPYDTDRYGRTVGVVYIGNVNVNESLIKAGYAWQYRKYCKAKFYKDWQRQEKKASTSHTKDSGGIQNQYRLGSGEKVPVIVVIQRRVVGSMRPLVESTMGMLNPCVPLSGVSAL